MGAWTEQQAREKLTDHFRLSDPINISLHRPVWVETDSGGREESSADTLGAQKFHIYPFKRRLIIESKFNPQSYGEDKVEYINWILMFNRQQDIDTNDYFDPSIDTTPLYDRLRAGRYEVVFISARLWDRGQAGLLYRG